MMHEMSVLYNHHVNRYLNSTKNTLYVEVRDQENKMKVLILLARDTMVLCRLPSKYRGYVFKIWKQSLRAVLDFHEDVGYSHCVK